MQVSQTEETLFQRKLEQGFLHFAVLFLYFGKGLFVVKWMGVLPAKRAKSVVCLDGADKFDSLCEKITVCAERIAGIIKIVYNHYTKKFSKFR